VFFFFLPSQLISLIVFRSQWFQSKEGGVTSLGKSPIPAFEHLPILRGLLRGGDPGSLDLKPSDYFSVVSIEGVRQGLKSASAPLNFSSAQGNENPGCISGDEKLSFG